MKKQKCRDGRIYINNNPNPKLRVEGQLNVSDRVTVIKEGLWKGDVGHVSAFLKDDEVLVAFKTVAMKFKLTEVERS